MSSENNAALPPHGIATAADVHQALRFLARKGAAGAAVPLGADGASAYAVRLAEQPRQTLALIPEPVAREACRRGWARRGEDGWLRLTPAGGNALRMHMTGIIPTGRGRPRKQHAATKAARARAERAVQESPLAWLRRRKDKDGRPLISDVQYDAGERLASDYRRAHMSRRVTSDWSGVVISSSTRRGPPGAGVDIADAVVAARERVNRALLAVGAELAGILIDICCHETGLEAAERAEGWPQRAAKVVLQLALTALARHYGLIAPERPAYSRLRHWGDEDYRPSIDG